MLTFRQNSDNPVWNKDTKDIKASLKAITSLLSTVIERVDGIEIKYSNQSLVLKYLQVHKSHCSTYSSSRNTSLTIVV